MFLTFLDWTMLIILQFDIVNIYVHQNGIFMVYIFLTILFNHVNVFVDNVNIFGGYFGETGLSKMECIILGEIMLDEKYFIK